MAAWLPGCQLSTLSITHTHAVGRTFFIDWLFIVQNGCIQCVRRKDKQTSEILYFLEGVSIDGAFLRILHSSVCLEATCLRKV